MATYSAIGPEPTEADPMSSSTGSLRGRRLGHSEYEQLQAETDPYRRGRGKKDAGAHGQATWISSVINLANTSTIRPNILENDIAG